MTFWHACYQLLIGPLELLFDVLFALAYRVLKHPGLTIVFLSLAVNFLVLPLYRRADALQAEQRDRANAMKPMVDHIRRTFRGDERFMMLKTYYRQQGYRQTDVLKGSVSLLLEIPFFIAAYRFLSGLSLLQGVSFGPIADLGAPDGMLQIGGLTIHLLPILMTLINAAAAAVYLKGYPLKDKLQMYGMALLFLVLLYGSPSGLVLYWTLNNLFSLGKNIFYKMKHPRRVLHILLAAVGLIGIVFVLFVHPISSLRHRLLLLGALLLPILPLLFDLLSPAIRRMRARHGKTAAVPVAPTGAETRGFFYGMLLLALLTGLLIPSAILHASPEEFLNTQARTPLMYLVESILLAAGTFVVWGGVFYRLADVSAKRWMGLGAWVLSVCAAVNYLFFGKSHGNLSEMLQYDTYVAPPKKEMLLNLLVLAVLVVLLAWIWKKKRVIVRIVALAMCCTVLGLSMGNVIGTARALRETESSAELAEIHLSKNGKNVIVFMLDRAITAYLPYVLEEKPELKEQFDGFVYYPNTLAFGGATSSGGPALFGGYEYRPININKRLGETLTEKHNEALKVMPVLFWQNGYAVTVCDPPLAGYRWRPDLTIYDDYPGIARYNTMGSMPYDMPSIAEAIDAFRARNFFCYGIYRIAPVVLQSTLYNNGRYNAAEQSAGEASLIAPQERDGLSKAEGLTDSFMRHYSTLTHLSDITYAEEREQNTFLFISNDSTHNGMLLKEPEYAPAAKVDNTAYDREHPTRVNAEGREIRFETDNQVIHYHVLVASLLEIGKWFDNLRASGVYDNTRIILVSDHGRTQGIFPELIYDTEKDYQDIMQFTSLLLVKDFDSHGFSTDWQYMTSADTPTLAFRGLIENPVNPFTGNPITDAAKQEPVQYTLQTFFKNFITVKNEEQIPGVWIRVLGHNVYDASQWCDLVEMPQE